MKDVQAFTELYFQEMQMRTSAKEKLVRSANESAEIDTCLYSVLSETKCVGVASDLVML